MIEIRIFDGSRRDAVGIIEVDRATFGDCLYTPEYIVSLESDPDQYAWVAEEEGQIVGFVSAFATHSLAADRWEVDELAVHPRAQGRGVGTALVARVVEQGATRGDLALARALVAVDNCASACVFAKCGFAPAATMYLMLHALEGGGARARRDERPVVRLAQPGDCPEIARLSGCDVTRAADLLARPDVVYLVAQSSNKVLAYAELIQVRTLQYEGIWIESMVFAPEGDAHWEKRLAEVLLDGAIREARRRGSLDKVGYLVSPGAASPCYKAAVGEGLQKAGEYRAFIKEWSS